MQRPRSDKVEAAQLLQILRKILCRFMAVVVSSAFCKSLTPRNIGETANIKTLDPPTLWGGQGISSAAIFIIFFLALTLNLELPELAELRGGFFCYFWAVSSKQMFLTKVVVWKGAQQTLSLPPAAAEGLQVHFNMGAMTMPRRQPKSVPESML